MKAVGEISTDDFGVPSASDRRCFSAEFLSPSSRQAHVQLFQRIMASTRRSSGIVVLILSAAVNTVAATSLFPLDHSIIA